MNDQTHHVFRKLRIEAVELYGGQHPLEIYIQLSTDKHVKIKHREEPLEDIITKYKKKGVKFVLVPESDFQGFANSVRAMLKEKMEKSPDDQLEEKGKALSAAHDIFKSVVNSGQINDEAKQLANQLTIDTLKTIKKSKISSLFNKFKTQCSEEFLHSTLTGHVSCAMIDQFNWSNDQVKEKVILAGMLCDITLTSEEFLILKNAKGDISKLTPKILEHPTVVAELVEKESNFVPQETLTIIKQHHERQGGKGYPKKLNHGAITILTAIYIVSNHFVERMFDENYSEEHQMERMKNTVSQMQERFNLGTFKKAWDALDSIFGESAPESISA